MNRSVLILTLTLLGFTAGASAQILIAPDPNGAINQDTSSIVTATAPNWNTLAVAGNTVNGSGLDASGQHTNAGWLANPGVLWMGEGNNGAGNGGSATPQPNSGTWTGPLDDFGRGSVWIRWDFDQTYLLDKATIWNHNEGGGNMRGLHKVMIEYTSDGNNWSLLDGGGLGGPGEHTFLQAPGADGYPGFDLSFDGVAASSVVFTVLANEGSVKNFGGSGNVGMSEIRFFTIPEPSVLSLLTVGGLVMMRRGKRRCRG